MDTITQHPAPDATTAERGTARATTLTAAGITAAAAAATLLLPRRAAAAVKAPTLTFSDIPGTGDIKVLNYALALETLEADLYAQAVTRLQAIGASAANRAYVQEFAQVEADHRDFLKSALGSAAITATGQPLAGATFDFGMSTLNESQVIQLLYTVEDTGTKAYLGAIPQFQTLQYLGVAGSIQATEARHTAAIAILARLLGVTADGFGNPVETAPLANNNHGIDPNPGMAGSGAYTPDFVLSKVSGPNGFIVLPG